MWERLTAWIAVLALLVTAQGAAFARAHTPSSDQVAICIGHVVLMIHVDEDGRATTAPELCFDASASLFVLGDHASPQVAPAPAVWAVGLYLSNDQRLPDAAPRAPPARGPPWI